MVEVLSFQMEESIEVVEYLVMVVKKGAGVGKLTGEMLGGSQRRALISLR
mgnify:CR=1 FL=1